MNILNKFYIKTGLKTWGLICLVYSFLLTNFIWGNHDWKFLKTGVSLKDGFFEARYSQHLPVAIIFDKNILPIFALLFSLLSLSYLGILIAKYLEFPKEEKIYLLFALFIGLNPHNFIIFYYIHYMFQIYFWTLIGIACLYLFSESYNLKNLTIGGVIYFLILGSYPPILALIFVLFLTKRLICYLDNKETELIILKKGFFFAAQFILAIIGFKLALIILEEFNLINSKFYNLQTNSMVNILLNLPKEFINSLLMHFENIQFLGLSYCIITSFLFALFICSLIHSKQFNLFSALLLIFALFASRSIVILAENGIVTSARVVYWGKLGINILFIAFLIRDSRKIIANLLFVWLLFCLVIFVKINLQTHKILYLEFNNLASQQERVKYSIIENEYFNIKNNYIAYSFGNFSYRNKYINITNNEKESVPDYLFLPCETIKEVFWNDNIHLVSRGVCRIGKNIYSNLYGNFKQELLQNNPINVKNMRQWTYTKAKVYPHKDSIYIDDKYIVLVLDKLDFYQNSELMLTNIDK